MLIIDEEGIIDQTTASAAGRVYWKDIAGLTYSHKRLQKMLYLHLVDFDEQLERSELRNKGLRKGGKIFYGNSVPVVLSTAKVNSNEMEAAIASFQKNI